MKKEKFKNGLMLFAFFFKIGCFTFGGGWSILAQMEQEFVVKKKLISKEELLDLVAVGKSVPGIMITNISMLFGYQVGGWFGGVCAVLGIVCPAVLILSAVAYGYDYLKSNVWCRYALEGIQAAVVPIIGCAALSLGKEVFRTRKGRVVCLLAFLACVFTQVSNVVLVLIGVAAALILPDSPVLQQTAEAQSGTKMFARIKRRFVDEKGGTKNGIS
ncbi:MAG: chromate transporter [Eubacteriales bacterium]|nr:chromate transporter [Eubacteriales bacterium]